MGKDALVQIRTEEELRRRAEAVYAAEGLTLAEATRLFYRESADRGRIPFAVSGRSVRNRNAQARATSRNAAVAGGEDDCAANDGRRHAAGCFAAFANPEKRSMEDGAFLRAMEAKHGGRA